ncbi:hypothetical protein K469DRAFT_710391, partial [Zopfia rhizophila CBS 207.26]
MSSIEQLPISVDSDVEAFDDHPASPASDVSVGSWASVGSSESSRSSPPSVSGVDEAPQSTTELAAQPAAQPATQPVRVACRNRTQRPPANYGDLDLSKLWDNTPKLNRDHLPPPELVYNSLKEAEEAIQAHGKANGVRYRRRKWEKGGR